MCDICAYYVNLYARYCEPIPCTLELAQVYLSSVQFVRAPVFFYETVIDACVCMYRACGDTERAGG
jgi:hypothetical protein